MRDTTTKALVVAMIAVVGLAALAGPASAELTSDPSVNTDSDVSDGATVTIHDANEENSTSLIVETDNGDSIESAEVEIQPVDRDVTVYEADDSADEYNFTAQAVDSSTDTHEWTISMDEFANAPVEFNDSTDLEFSVEVTDSAGDSGTVNGTFTLDNAGDRASVVVDQAAIDDDSVGPDVTVEEASDGIFGIGGEEHDTYEVEATPATGGNGSQVELYLANSDVASAFADEANVGAEASFFGLRGADEPESEERVHDLTAAYDGNVGALFYESADTGIVGDADTYATYDSDANVITYNVGDGYNASDTMEIHASNDVATSYYDASAFDATVYDGLSVWALDDYYGFMTAFDLSGFSIPFL